MNITITGKEITATEAIKDYAEKKLTRLEKYYGDENIDCNVTIKKESVATETAMMFVTVKGISYKAVSEERDLYAALDKNIDIIEGQIRKTKAKREKMQKEASIKQMNFDGLENFKVEDEIVRAVSYELKPISIEDAKLKLQEKPGNNFYTFINVDTGKVNVLYKLKDNKNFGLIEPEA